MSGLAAELRAAAEASGVHVPPRLVEACEAHFGLLVTWNKTHNLTRITAPRDAARAHYLDSLAPLLGRPAPRHVVDVGSGAGFPGLLAALAWPQARVTLVEPASKRASFLTLAAAAMGVTVDVVAPGAGVRGDCVLSRATFPPGARRELLGSAEPGGAIGVWGHSHDAATWATEVATWGAVVEPAWPYAVDELGPRCVLQARVRSG